MALTFIRIYADKKNAYIAMIYRKTLLIDILCEMPISVHTVYALQSVSDTRTCTCELSVCLPNSFSSKLEKKKGKVCLVFKQKKKKKAIRHSTGNLSVHTGSDMRPWQIQYDVVTANVSFNSSVFSSLLNELYKK